MASEIAWRTQGVLRKPAMFRLTNALLTLHFSAIVFWKTPLSINLALMKRAFLFMYSD